MGWEASGSGGLSRAARQLILESTKSPDRPQRRRRRLPGTGSGFVATVGAFILVAEAHPPELATACGRRRQEAVTENLHSSGQGMRSRTFRSVTSAVPVLPNPSIASTW